MTLVEKTLSFSNYNVWDIHRAIVVDLRAVSTFVVKNKIKIDFRLEKIKKPIRKQRV